MSLEFEQALKNVQTTLLTTEGDTIINALDLFNLLPPIIQTQYTNWVENSSEPSNKLGIHEENATENSINLNATKSMRIAQTIGAIKALYKTNYIEVLTEEIVPRGKWFTFTLSYNGSSSADGISIYIDGVKRKQNVTFDNLNGSIRVDRVFLVGAACKDCQSQGGVIGAADAENRKLNISGVPGIAFDDFRIYRNALTELEIKSLANINPFVSGNNKTFAQLSNKNKGLLREYYLSIYDKNYKSLRRELTYLRYKDFPIPEVMIMEDIEPPRDTYVLTRGMYDAPTIKVNSGTPESILPFPDDYPRNRLGLAWWLTTSKNPLTSRVAVNRYWQLIFGHGIVSTPDDFGSQGSLPTHPLLLDWLAVEFMESGWDLKGLLKKMLMSSTYMQSSRIAPGALKKDYDNTYYSRNSNERLTAEMIRDHVLAISGLLNREIGGPPVKPYQPRGVWQQIVSESGGEFKYRESKGFDLYRRSLYSHWRRTVPPPSMITLDASTRDKCTVKRQATNTPLQSLVLLNDPQYVEASRILAEKMIKEGGSNVKDRIIFAFRLATSRKPNVRELGELVDLYDQQVQYYSQMPEASLELFSIGDSPVDSEIDNTALAACTIIASTIINLDETIRQG